MYDNFLKDDSLIAEEKEKIEEEKRLFKNEKRTFDEERKRFTEAAIKLGHEVSDIFARYVENSLCHFSSTTALQNTNINKVKLSNNFFKRISCLPSLSMYLTLDFNAF